MRNDEFARDRWENEGGKTRRRWETSMSKPDSFYEIEDHKLMLLPPFAHKKPQDDDLGLPEDPIYSNYVKYLWTSHTKSGGVQIGRAFSRPTATRRRQ
jgi:hypothetical protein